MGFCYFAPQRTAAATRAHPASRSRSPRERVRRRPKGHLGAMPKTATEERTDPHVAIPRVLERSAGDVVRQVFDRLLSSNIRATTAVEARRLLADDEDTEELTDAIQRFVAIATPVVRIAARGARFTRVPWVLVTSTVVSLGVTVRNGVRELQAIAALLAHRLEDDTGGPPDPALVQKLTLELYLNPRRTPDVSDLGLPVAALARRWIVSGALGRSTLGKTEKALDAAESLDLSLVPLLRPRGR